MTGRQVLEVHAESAAPAETVWQLLGDVTTWTEWAGFDEAEYERQGSPPPHGVGAVRRFRAGRLRSKETVLAFDAPRRLSYDYVGSLPIRNYRADVTLVPQSEGTRITWHSEFEAKIPLTGPLLRVGLRRILQSVASRLAVAADARQRA